MSSNLINTRRQSSTLLQPRRCSPGSVQWPEHKWSSMLPTMNSIMQRGRSTIRTIRQGQMMASIDPAPHPPLFLHLQMLPTSIQPIGIKTESSILHSAPKHTWPDESEVEQSSKRRKQSHKVVLPRPYSVAKFKLTLQKTSRNIRNPRSRSGSPAPATANASLQTKSKRQHIARWHTSGASTSKITSCPTARRERGLGRDRKHHRAFAPAAQARS